MAVASTCAQECRRRSNSVILLRSSRVFRSGVLFLLASINQVPGTAAECAALQTLPEIWRALLDFAKRPECGIFQRFSFRPFPAERHSISEQRFVNVCRHGVKGTKNASNS